MALWEQKVLGTQRDLWVAVATCQYLTWGTFPGSKTHRLKVFLLELNIKIHLFEIENKLCFFFGGYSVFLRGALGRPQCMNQALSYRCHVVVRSHPCQYWDVFMQPSGRWQTNLSPKPSFKVVETFAWSIWNNIKLVRDFYVSSISRLTWWKRKIFSSIILSSCRSEIVIFDLGTMSSKHMSESSSQIGWDCIMLKWNKLQL